MSVARLIENMAAAGAPIDAIVIAVRAIEERNAVGAERQGNRAQAPGARQEA